MDQLKKLFLHPDGKWLEPPSMPTVCTFHLLSALLWLSQQSSRHQHFPSCCWFILNLISIYGLEVFLQSTLECIKCMYTLLEFLNFFCYNFILFQQSLQLFSFFLSIFFFFCLFFFVVCVCVGGGGGGGTGTSLLNKLPFFYQFAHLPTFYLNNIFRTTCTDACWLLKLLKLVKV